MTEKSESGIKTRKEPRGMREASKIGALRESILDNRSELAHERLRQAEEFLVSSLQLIAEHGTVSEGLGRIKIALEGDDWNRLTASQQTEIRSAASRVKAVDNRSTFASLNRGNGCVCEVREFKELCEKYRISVPETVIQAVEKANADPQKYPPRKSSIGKPPPLMRT